jgi:PilZ domain-containing protein
MIRSRIAPRHHVSKAATIKLVGGAVDCVVRDLSITGAAIEVANPASIPKSFVLVVPDDGLQLSCEVVWRRQFRIGVKFD